MANPVRPRPHLLTPDGPNYLAVPQAIDGKSDLEAWAMSIPGNHPSEVVEKKD